MNNKGIIMIITVILLLASLSVAHAQGADAIPKEPRFFNPVITGAHLFTITPDARSAGMGETGLTTDADAFSAFHNISKLPFTDNKWGIAISYTPWMAEVTKDMNLSYLTGYYSWGSDERTQHAVTGSFRYFHIGEGIAFLNHLYEPVAIKPYELSVDLGYGIRMGEYWSVGIGIKYLRSDYNFSSEGISSAINALLFDLSTTYRTSVSLGEERTGDLSFALALNNLGGKMTTDGGKSYLYAPAIFRLGIGLETEVVEMHKIGMHLEMSKMMAPTYPLSDQNNRDQLIKKYMNQSALDAFFGSWTDAPGGAAEEWREMMFGVGAEYVYDDRFFVRAGYRYQHQSKGTGAGFTLGGGLNYRMARVDLSYFLATQPKSPLNNTLRFTLAVDF